MKSIIFIAFLVISITTIILYATISKRHMKKGYINYEILHLSSFDLLTISYSKETSSGFYLTLEYVTIISNNSIAYTFYFDNKKDVKWWYKFMKKEYKDGHYFFESDYIKEMISLEHLM